jgi:hypothetical protein
MCTCKGTEGFESLSLRHVSPGKTSGVTLTPATGFGSFGSLEVTSSCPSPQTAAALGVGYIRATPNDSFLLSRGRRRGLGRALTRSRARDDVCQAVSELR